ncbi:inner membrane protein yfiN domain protein [Shigella flexneri K-227]|uniref:Inner membrane protein yfiN domain protein n=1 Tax=Shigella flexneri K-227 TaxID=766147 RepID=F5NZ21_SHIFL|nr:inner membrane protein yfiN domain protein [Shigella flexneri K-272]EGK34860.1 inner membrane protein yfiN domain protein [Shigella flexneri K-227]
MDNDNSLNKRPTFKRALRNISMTSIFITMMLIWLLLSVTSVLTLKQYAQKNLALAALGQQGHFQLQKYVISSKIFWHPGITPVRIQAILSAIS